MKKTIPSKYVKASAETVPKAISLYSTANGTTALSAHRAWQKAIFAILTDINFTAKIMKQNRNSDKKRHHEETIHDRQYRSMVKRYKWKNHAIIAGALLGFSVLILFIIVSDIPLTAANVAVGLAVLNGACWLLLRLLCRPAYNLSIQIPMKNDRRGAN